jgi:hypothetical protein
MDSTSFFEAVILNEVKDPCISSLFSFVGDSVPLG